LIKLLLVEDEAIEREAINMILSGRNEYTIVGEAVDGEDALIKVRSLRPDIVLMDIRIGKIGGLEVCRIINAESLGVEVIIISAYDRFDYSRQAFRAGAYDFLVKPVEPSTLLESLAMVRDKISQSRNKCAAQKSLKEQISGFLIPFLLQNFLGLPGGNQKLNELKGVFSLLGIEEGRAHVALVLKCMGEGCSIIVKEQMANFQPVGYKIITTPIFDDKILVFVSHDHNQLTDNSLRRLVGELLLFFDSHNLNSSLQVGVGRIYDRVASLVRSVKEAVNTLQIAEIMNKPELRFYVDLDTKAYKDNLSEIYGKMQSVSELVQNNDLKQALQQIRTLSLGNVVFEKQNEVSELIRLVAYEIMLFALHTMNGRLVSEQSLGLLKKSWHSQWKKCATLLDLLQWLTVVLTKVEEVQSKHDEIGDERVIKALEYMEGNYNRDISLVSVSQHINISAQYLSRLFKTKAGLTFSDYLNKIRIDVAKKMLTDSNCRPIKKIAMEIGYSSDIYFAFVFKKVTGLTPKEYREQHSR